MSLPSHFPKTISFALNAPRPSAVPLAVLSKAILRAEKTPCLVNAAQVRIQKNHFPPCCFPLFHHVHNLLASEFPALVFLCVRAWSHTPPKHPHQQHSAPSQPEKPGLIRALSCPCFQSRSVVRFLLPAAARLLPVNSRPLAASPVRGQGPGVGDPPQSV